jgi:hypothetical protein
MHFKLLWITCRIIDNLTWGLTLRQRDEATDLAELIGEFDFSQDADCRSIIPGGFHCCSNSTIASRRAIASFNTDAAHSPAVPVNSSSAYPWLLGTLHTPSFYCPWLRWKLLTQQDVGAISFDPLI